jgi:hypothetical protein
VFEFCQVKMRAEIRQLAARSDIGEMNFAEPGNYTTPQGEVRFMALKPN